MINKIYKSALITGAGDGIGYETLKRFLEEKITVYAVIFSSRNLLRVS